MWLLDDNSTPHQSPKVRAWISSKNIQRWIQPDYSPDISTCDFGCFHSLKRALGGVVYSNLNSLKSALDFNIQEGNFNDNYQAARKLPGRWKPVVNFEGEHI